MFKNITVLTILFLFISSCATYDAQYKDAVKLQELPNKEVAHSFYFIGNAANTNKGASSKVLEAFKLDLSKASKNSTAIFLGDNIPSKSISEKSASNFDQAKRSLNVQTAALDGFEGESVFIPGQSDWKGGLSGLKKQEKMIENAIGKETFLPENGCPIENIHISDKIELIIIDSQWFMANWDDYPTINDDCDIKTRERFFNEYGSIIKKSRSKTTIVALHHPIYSNGPYGGQFSIGSHMKPVPVVGTIKNVIRKSGGVSKSDAQNKRYNEFKQRLITISQENKKVVFVSGHEQNLQYIVEDNLRQIISGSGSEATPTRNIGGGQFSYGALGYTRLDVYTDGSSFARFYATEENKVVFQTEVLKPDVVEHVKTYDSSFPKERTASIYTEEETDKSGFYKFLWGDRYRHLYSTKVTAPTVNLDTMYGGLKIIRKGGGNQSKSLRLEDKNGAQYVMRALRKNAVQYLQATMFKNQYIKGQFDDTATEDLILDVFAGSHPYAPFAIGTLSDAVGVFHTNPVLYYVPKQHALGHFNSEFGDELYMIEEHTSEGHSDLASFGFQDKMLSTDDVMKKIHKDEDIVIDEASYIRARLFDMLIGDWDRHHDQWRWIEFKENGKKVYRPLPRDRDQAFSKMSDGLVLGSAVVLIETASMLKKYSDDLVDAKGINIEPYPIDMELIQVSDKSVWDEQVRIIQEGITDEVIENAFLNFPEEVRDHTLDDIKSKLKARRGNLQLISDRYYKLVNRFGVVKGTNKDDWFDIERLATGETRVTGYRIKHGEKGEIFHDRTYKPKEVKEIWIYSLDDEDVFHVFGNGPVSTIIRLIGGQNNDTYDIQNGKKIKYYDYKSKKNTVVTNKGSQHFRDDYETNVYNYKKLKNNLKAYLPFIGSNPDDGLKVGVTGTFTKYNFERNPFSSLHIISAAYYFATEGFDLNYNGEFANVVKNLNLGIDAHFNSPNYAINFFGLGNETSNFEADENDGVDADLDFNRVKIRTFKVMPSLIWKGELGSSIKAGLFYESNEVERTAGRFLETILPTTDNVFDKQDFYGLDVTYHFKNKDHEAFPTLGMQASLQTGYKSNLETSNGFGYVKPEIGFDYKLIPSGQLVLATDFRGHVNLGNDFEFYQGATLGANSGLRGYRNERFTGKSAFVQSTDVRWNFSNLKTSIVPLHIGMYGGVDYGRVWIKNDNSKKWNNSFGGGIFVNMADMMTGTISAFNSDDGLRLAFQLGFGF